MLDHQQKIVEIIPHDHKRNGLLSSLIPYHPSQVQVRV
ncbi:hypothetical protein NC652_001854 [Populus alba x Populus x berolinensis]|nr:hypothetical protein NC652_001854 [Populus alba x Populus x berolinensis]